MTRKSLSALAVAAATTLLLVGCSPEAESADTGATAAASASAATSVTPSPTPAATSAASADPVPVSIQLVDPELGGTVSVDQVIVNYPTVAEYTSQVTMLHVTIAGDTTGERKNDPNSLGLAVEGQEAGAASFQNEDLEQLAAAGLPLLQLSPNTSSGVFEFEIAPGETKSGWLAWMTPANAPEATLQWATGLHTFADDQQLEAAVPLG